MRNFKKMAFFSIILIVTMICFSLLSIFFFFINWGATTHNHFKGINTINWSKDLDEETRIVLSCDEQLDEEKKEDIERILTKRLILSGIGENEFYFDNNSNIITICFPASYSKYFFDYGDIASYLSAKGEVKIFKTEKNPRDFMSLINGKNDKDDKEELLMTDDSINSAVLRYVKQNQLKGEVKSQDTNPAIMLSFNASGKEKIVDIYTTTTVIRKEINGLEKEIKLLTKEIEKTKKNMKKEEEEKKEEEKKEEEKKEEEKKEEEKKEEDELKELEENLKNLQDRKRDLFKELTKQNIKINLDANTIYEGNILSLVNENNKVCATNLSLNSASAITTAVNLMNSEKLPVNLNVISVNNYSPSLGAYAKYNSIIFILILFLILILFISLKFKILGILALLTTFTQISLMIAGYTGFLAFFPGFCVNIYSIFGVVFGMLIGFVSFYYIAKRITTRIKNNINLELSIKQTYKGDVRQIIKLNLLVILISIILMGIFSPARDVLSMLFLLFSAMCHKI